MRNSVSLKRSELYNRVWQMPMSRLAQEYGLSDVGLAKICKKHNIPRPPRGYWARLEHGQTPRQKPLPNPEDDCEIKLPAMTAGTAYSAKESDEVSRLVADEERDDLRIMVADTLREPHELVSESRQALQQSRVQYDGLIECSTDAPLAIRVSRKQVHRALRIMDALIKALEQRGHAVTAGPTVSILDQPIRFRVSEQIAKERRDCDDVDLNGPYRFGHSRTKEVHVSTGNLTLSIPDAAVSWAGGCQRRWADTRAKKLEERLNEFVAGLITFAGRMQRHKEEEAKERERRRHEEAQQRERARQEQLRREEEARIRAEKRRLYDAERERVETLLAQAQNWQKSQMVRRLIDAVREVNADEAERPGSEIAKWLEWATQQADRLDPLCESPPSILDEDLETQKPSPQYGSRW